MALTPTQVAFVSRILADPPVNHFTEQLAAVTAEVYDRSLALITTTDGFNSALESVGAEAIAKGLTNPAESAVAFVPGNINDYGRGVFLNQSPLRPQADFVSTVERSVIDAVRRAFHTARPEPRAEGRFTYQ